MVSPGGQTQAGPAVVIAAADMAAVIERCAADLALAEEPARLLAVLDAAAPRDLVPATPAPRPPIP